MKMANLMQIFGLIQMLVFGFLTVGLITKKINVDTGIIILLLIVFLVIGSIIERLSIKKPDA